MSRFHEENDNLKEIKQFKKLIKKKQHLSKYSVNLIKQFHIDNLSAVGLKKRIKILWKTLFVLYLFMRSYKINKYNIKKIAEWLTKLL